MLGRRLSETSPDRGSLSYRYDLANNLIEMTDGRGIVTTYTYDVLERMIEKSFPTSPSENVRYVYDSCSFGIGRLCEVEDESGSSAYQYDAYGNISQMSKTELGQSYSTGYEYDDGDRPIRISYPSGRVIDLQRDGIRRIRAITATVNGRQQPIISGLQYRGDHRMTQRSFGNGLTESRRYDLQGRLLSQTLNGQPSGGGGVQAPSIDSRSYAYDANGNLLSRSGSAQTGTYAYDRLDRLISDAVNAAAPSPSKSQYQYDLNHNRQSKTHTGNNR